MNLESVRASIVGFNGTSAGRNATTAKELRTAWLMRKASGGKRLDIEYLVAYRENKLECDETFSKLRGLE